MAFSANMTLEVRATGSDTNGGGFLPGASGTDWSQQDTAQYSVTDGVTAGSTTITSATASFGTDVVGNVMYVSGGTGSVVGNWYQIISRTNATTIVVDRSTGLTAGTGVTLRIGGALASPGGASKAITDSLSNSVAYIKVFVKYNASPYVITSATAGVAGGCVSINNNHIWVGYDTVRSEYQLNFNRPTLQLNSGVSTATIFGNLNATGYVQGFILDGNLQTVSKGHQSTGQVFNVKAMNFTSFAIAQNSANGRAIYCEVTGCVTAGVVLFTFSSAYYCSFHDNTNTTGSGVSNIAVAVPSSGLFVGCISYNNVGYDGFGSGGHFLNCIAYNNTYCGFNAHNTTSDYTNCITESNGTYGFRTNSSGAGANLLNCASYNNGTARSLNSSARVSDTNPVAATSSLFTNAAGQDFSLNNDVGAGAACRALGLPTLALPGTSTISYGDIGFQHSEGAMASTKVRTPIWSSQTLTAGAGNTTSSVINLSTGYGAQVDVVLTNGATGPTVPAQVQIQVANDYNGGSPTLWTNFGGPLVGTSANNDVAYWSVVIPPTAAAVRLVAGSNTAQNVTVSADLSNVTAI